MPPRTNDCLSLDAHGMLLVRVRSGMAYSPFAERHSDAHGVARIKAVAQGIAEQVQAEQHQHDCQGWTEHHPGVVPQEGCLRR